MISPSISVQRLEKCKSKASKLHRFQIHMLISLLDLHKVYIDDEDTKNVHGHAYKFYGVDTSHGTIVIVRPDQCE